jgi:Rrf2 family transcriptional regulator, nitric oxide-sensitive transcriptional repressor
MRLALQTDYSLRTLMFLAARPGRQTVSGVAGFFQISETHVGKVVNQLVQLGYVRSTRGIGGGLELAKPPDEISIGAVVQAVEGNVHLLECVGTDDVCVIQRHCKLRTVLDRAERIQFEYLNSVRLSDVLPFGTPTRNLARPALRPRASRPTTSRRRASSKRSKPGGDAASK